VTSSAIAAEAMERLAERGCVTEFASGSESAAELAGKVAAFRPDALIVRKGVIDRAVLEASGALRAITKHGVGVDRIDVETATRMGIPVMITPRANFESVAEHALALLLAVVRRVPDQDRRLRRGEWANKGFNGAELLGKTLGLVGYGRIARRLAELVRPFRMDVLAFDPYQEPEAPVRKAATLGEMLAAADVVSIHCPLTPGTRGLIGREELSLMKPGACLINTARGAIVDEAALAEALREGRIAGAGLDTFEQEPPAEDNPLLSMDTVVATSHVGGFSDSSFRNMGLGAVENVLTVLDGGRVDNECVINREVFVGPATGQKAAGNP